MIRHRCWWEITGIQEIPVSSNNALMGLLPELTEIDISGNYISGYISDNFLYIIRSFSKICNRGYNTCNSSTKTFLGTT